MFEHDAKAFGRLWMERLRGDPLARRVVATLSFDSEAHVEPVLNRTRRENPIIGALIESDLAQTTRRHILEHFRALLLLPTERARELGDDPLAFVREHGVRRARAGIPLRAVLQAYRGGHKSFWEAICEMINRFAKTADEGLRTTMLLSDYCIDYTDLISVVVTDAHIAEEALLAAQRTRLSIAIIEDLLQGEPPRSREALDLCEQVGIGDGRAMVMLVARRPDCPGDAPFSARDRSVLAQGLETALPRAEFGRIIDLRLSEVVAVISCENDPGFRVARALRTLIDETLGPAGASTRIGIGLDVNKVAELPRSYAEALTAIDILGSGSPVAHLAEVNVDAYLRHTADATARRLAPAWSDALKASKFVPTLRAFAAASLNVKACANSLKVHNNTVYHRLNSVRRLTGVDPRTYAGLSHLLAVLSIEPRRSAPRGEARSAHAARVRIAPLRSGTPPLNGAHNN